MAPDGSRMEGFRGKKNREAALEEQFPLKKQSYERKKRKIMKKNLIHMEAFLQRKT